MDPSQIYIVIAVICLAIIVSQSLKNKGSKNNKLSQMASITFAFVLVGVFSTGNRSIGYSLIIFGVILSFTNKYLKK